MSEQTLEIKATVRFRNNKMIHARKLLGLSQINAAKFSGVQLLNVINLEMLRYPQNLSINKIEALADLLNLKSEDIYPESLRGTSLVNSKEEIKTVSIGNLLEYTPSQEQRLLSASPMEVAENSDMVEKIERTLMHLKKNERAVLMARFGLAGEKEQTLSQIGKRLYVTKERVRQIELQGIKRLKYYLVKEIPEKEMALLSRWLDSRYGPGDWLNELDEDLQLQEREAKSKLIS